MNCEMVNRWSLPRALCLQCYGIDDTSYFAKIFAESCRATLVFFDLHVPIAPWILLKVNTGRDVQQYWMVAGLECGCFALGREHDKIISYTSPKARNVLGEYQIMNNALLFAVARSCFCAWNSRVKLHAVPFTSIEAEWRNRQCRYPEVQSKIDTGKTIIICEYLSASEAQSNVDWCRYI